MNTIPDRRRSWLIAALALVLAVTTVYLISRPARPPAGPEPVSALAPAPTAAPSATGATQAPPATARTVTPPATAHPVTPPVPTSPTRNSRPAADADLVVVVPTGTPGRAPAAGESAPRRCVDWLSQSSDQQHSHAAALLMAARQNDGDAKVAPPSVVRAYRLAITTACTGPDRADDNVADVARVVSETDRDRWGL